MVHLFAVSRRRVSVENRTAESDPAFGAAIGPQRQVPAADDELEFSFAGSSKNGDALVGTPFVSEGVVAQLPQESRIPLRVQQAREDIVNDELLLFCIKVAANARTRDLPVVCEKSPHQAPLLVTIIPVKADLGSLRVSETFPEIFNSSFNGAAGRRGRGLAPRQLGR